MLPVTSSDGGDSAAGDAAIGDGSDCGSLYHTVAPYMYPERDSEELRRPVADAGPGVPSWLR